MPSLPFSPDRQQRVLILGIDLRALPRRAAVLREQHRAAMADRHPVPVVGKGDRGERGQHRRRGHLPALAVVVGVENAAALADDDEALAGLGRIEQQHLVRQRARFGHERGRRRVAWPRRQQPAAANPRRPARRPRRPRARSRASRVATRGRDDARMSLLRHGRRVGRFSTGHRFRSFLALRDAVRYFVPMRRSSSGWKSASLPLTPNFHGVATSNDVWLTRYPPEVRS